MEKKYYWFGAAAIVVVMLYTHLHIFTAPDCVNIRSVYTVKVETMYENTVPLECNAEEINVWLEKYNFELADSDSRIYVKK